MVNWTLKTVSLTVDPETWKIWDSNEIVGIPQEIEDDKLEDDVIDIFKEAEVPVNRQTPDKWISTN